MGYNIVEKTRPNDDLCKNVMGYFYYTVSRLKGNDLGQTLAFYKMF